MPKNNTNHIDSRKKEVLGTQRRNGVTWVHKGHPHLCLIFLRPPFLPNFCIIHISLQLKGRQFRGLALIYPPTQLYEHQVSNASSHHRECAPHLHIMAFTFPSLQLPLRFPFSLVHWTQFTPAVAVTGLRAPVSTESDNGGWLHL